NKHLLSTSCEIKRRMRKVADNKMSRVRQRSEEWRSRNDESDPDLLLLIHFTSF
ncbi:hypothetical protein CEXT_4571, partial [Caerostris extrusa]